MKESNDRIQNTAFPTWIVLSEIETTELRDTWKKKPNTARLLAALELAREALSQ